MSDKACEVLNSPPPACIDGVRCSTWTGPSSVLARRRYLEHTTTGRGPVPVVGGDVDHLAAVRPSDNQCWSRARIADTLSSGEGEERCKLLTSGLNHPPLWFQFLVSPARARSVLHMTPLSNDNT